MTSTAHRTHQPTLSRHIDAPVEAVRSLIANLDQQAARFGRHRLHADIPPTHEFPLRYRVTTRRTAVALLEFRLSPSLEGGSQLAWSPGQQGSLPWRVLGGRAKLAAAAAELAARLASMAEDRPTTRAEWADRGYELAA